MTLRGNGGIRMHSIEEQMAEIKKRKTFYTVKKQLKGLTAAAAALALLLIGAMIYAPGVRGGADEATGSVYGSTILGPEAGGYVIVALIAFALGIVITLAVQKARKMKETAPESEK